MKKNFREGKLHVQILLLGRGGPGMNEFSNL